ncbi:MAG: DNA-processing protein DprA, partial [Acidobacteria bacterium]|nr:DNA-processing protein DprA [Acidobacteriota bacterium]
MTDLSDFVALSLLPVWCWRAAAEHLRSGDHPADILRRLADDHWRDQPDKLATLRADADEALERAGAHQIAPIAWCDASYPVALTTIVDPPPVLWTRGRVPALSTPAVAIVGARAASPYGLSVAERLA